MWACARGKLEAVAVLYRWNTSALNVCNKMGSLPVSVARCHCFHHIAEMLERLEMVRVNTLVQAHAQMVLDMKHGQTFSDMHAGMEQPSLQPSMLHDNPMMEESTLTHQRLPMAVDPVVSPGHAQQPMFATPSMPPSGGGTSKQAIWRNMDNLKIDIPPPPPYCSQNNSAMFISLSAHTTPDNSAHSTPDNSAHSTPDNTPTGQSSGDTPLHICYSRLLKRTSVEVLPGYLDTIITDTSSKCSKTDLKLHDVGQGLIPQGQIEVNLGSKGQSQGGLRTVNSDPHLASMVNPMTSEDNPMLSVHERDLNSPIIFMDTMALGQAGLTLEDIQRENVDMETDTPPSGSPYTNIDKLASVEEEELKKSPNSLLGT